VSSLKAREKRRRKKKTNDGENRFGDGTRDASGGHIKRDVGGGLEECRCWRDEVKRGGEVDRGEDGDDGGEDEGESVGQFDGAGSFS
jgi:hypothetical protein